ncbi:GIY-YIG nuclease family protein [Candidatus Collierbacteria bacterium]|nr:GIY-YIG nuclease family protein [Candidatus Collierbacteria bacterium]
MENIMYFVYMLLCQDGSYYIGSSNNVEKRLKDHLNGKGGKYTKSHKPLKLVYQEALGNKSEALKREFQLKQWSRVRKEILAQSVTFP